MEFYLRNNETDVYKTVEALNVGDKVVSGLRANDQINWVFTDAEDAVEGTKAGKYYAALVIPENFSKQMLTFYEGDSTSAVIDYYVNKKKNAIAPNIIGTGADALSYTINETFAQTVTEIATDLAQSLSRYAQEDDVDGRLAIFTEHLRSVSARIDQTASVLDLYSSMADQSKSLVESSAGLMDTARSQAKDALSKVDTSKQRLRNLSKKLSTSVDDLASALSANAKSLKTLEQKMDALLASGVDDAQAIAPVLRKEAAEVEKHTDELVTILAVLVELRELLDSEAGVQVGGGSASGSGDSQLVAGTINSHTPALDKVIELVTETIKALQKTDVSLTKAADNLESGSAGVQEKAELLHKQAAQARSDIAAAENDFETNLKPGIEKLKSDLDTLSDDLERAGSSLDSLAAGFSSTLGSAGVALGEASGKVDEASAKLRTTAQSWRNLADAVDSALASGDTEKLRTLLEGSVGDLASALTAPVKVERVALFPSENFGSSMAPLYCTLALFIGSLLIMVAMKPEVSVRGREKLGNPKPRELFFGRFGTVGFVSLLQTTLLGLGSLLLIGVQVAEPLLFMFAFWFSGLVFAFIVYTLVVAFRNLGKGLTVLLLIIQVTACGGSYPLQILPGFVQLISPWVPATYVVRGLRAAMMGVYQNDFWISMAHLALFLIPFLLLGLVLRKSLERFMKFYVSKVEECKIME